jgi:hypothetical protein
MSQHVARFSRYVSTVPNATRPLRATWRQTKSGPERKSWIKVRNPNSSAYLDIIFIPPLALLGAGLALRWIFSGLASD